MYRLVSLLLAFVFASVTGISHGRCDEWPTKPIQIIVPYSAGSTGDVVMRLIGEAIEPRLGQPLVIDSRPGAGGNIGAAVVAKSAPDGYTLLLGATNNFVVNQFLYRNQPLDPERAFAPITKIVDLPYVVYVRSTVPARTLGELVEYCRKNPEKVFYASSGVGTAPHLGGELLNQLANISMVHVPFRSNAASITSLLTDTTQVYIASVAAGKGYVESGELRILAVAAPERLADLPDVPSAVEAGYPGFVVNNWWALAAPSGTPPSIIRRLQEEISRAIASPALKERFHNLQLIGVGNSPDALAREIGSEAASWKEMIRQRNIQVE